MQQINIKPLSVNEAWKGRRSKSVKYMRYQTAVLFMLKPMKLPEKPFKITYTFGFSSLGSDIDNPVKPFTDILQKKYKFNDSAIFEMNIKKVKVAKGSEFIHFNIEHYEEKPA